MSLHRAKLNWKRITSDFVYETYDRTHEITLEGGSAMKGSAAPQFMGNAKHANPEELLVAALSSCHLLTFLAVSAKSRLTVNSYEDEPVGTLEKNEEGKMAVTKIILRPRVSWEGASPATEKIQELHEKAHRNCMIGNSIKCEVIIEPTG